MHSRNNATYINQSWQPSASFVFYPFLIFIITIIIIIIIIMMKKKNFNRRSSHGHHGSRFRELAYGNTHTHVDRSIHSHTYINTVTTTLLCYIRLPFIDFSPFKSKQICSFSTRRKALKTAICFQTAFFFFFFLQTSLHQTDIESIISSCPPFVQTATCIAVSRSPLFGISSMLYESRQKILKQNISPRQRMRLTSQQHSVKILTQCFQGRGPRPHGPAKSQNLRRDSLFSLQVQHYATCRVL